MNPPNPAPTRRSFLGTMLAASVAPAFIPSRLLGAGGAVPPSGKISVGILGVGEQGRADMINFLGQPDVRVTAICDVNERNLATAREILAKHYGKDDVKIHRDFLDAIHHGKPTICGIESSVRGDTLCQLALIAIQQGRKLKWDPQAEKFPDDAGANAMLQARPFRGDWKLPEA